MTKRPTRPIRRRSVVAKLDSCCKRAIAICLRCVPVLTLDRCFYLTLVSLCWARYRCSSYLFEIWTTSSPETREMTAFQYSSLIGGQLTPCISRLNSRWFSSTGNRRKLVSSKKPDYCFLEVWGSSMRHGWLRGEEKLKPLTLLCSARFQK